MATVLTQVGEEWIVDKIDTATKMDYIDWGTGTNTAIKGDTGLQTPGGESRVQGAVTQPLADKYQVLGTMTATAAKNISEAGLFNASTSGTMLIRGDFTAIPLQNGDKIEFTFQLEIT